MSTSSYMDIDDFMEVLDQSTDPCDKVVTTRPNYDMLLQSLATLGKMIDKGESPLELAKAEANEQDLTAELFCTMSDTEMLNHFIPMKGIDYEGYPTDEKLKKDSDIDSDFLQIMPAADDFMPYKMIPQMNPVYKLSSAMKNNLNDNENVALESLEADSRTSNDVSEAEIPSPTPQSNRKRKSQQANMEVDKSAKKQMDELPDNNDDEPRQIKRRKPRTYKYNPKPLQHKISRAFVPDGMKDREYWERRKRNNEAAKKSREERRKKELEVMKSYEMMKQEYTQIKVENIRLKARNAVLEKQVAELKGKLKD